MTKTLIKNCSLISKTEILPERSVLIENGKIIRIDKAISLADSATEIIDARGAYLTPGLIDLHIHGFGGYGPELGAPEALLSMSEKLSKQGVTAFCPTLYCAQPSSMIKLLKKLSPAIGQEKGAKIIGFHLEGPFISPAKPGVMKPQDIIAPDIEILKQLHQAAGGHIAAITLAPE